MNDKKNNDNLPQLKQPENNKNTLIPTILLFMFFVIIIVSFVLILIDDRKPKYVQLDLKQVANNVTEPEKKVTTDLYSKKDINNKNTLPIAQFNVKTPVYVGEQIFYEDLSYDKDLGDSIINRHWEGKPDFFTKAGTYTITLKVQDSYGAWSEPVSHVVQVLDRPVEKYNTPPIALFKAPSPVYVGETVIFEDGSYDPDGDAIVYRKWEGKQISYNSPGTYKVSLMVQDSKGKWSDPTFMFIEVKDKPVVEIQRKPIAIFDVTSPVYVNQKVIYYNKSFDPDNGDKIVKTEWSGAKQDVYTKPGKYDVYLRVQDNHGAWSEPFKRTIEVIETPNLPPVADFNFKNPIYVNEPVEFINTSYDKDGVVTKEQWGGDVRYMYTKAGDYSVTLTVWDDRGAKSSITKKITVLDAHNKIPVAKFRTNSPVIVGQRVYFWDDSFDEDGTIVKREWSGDKRDTYDKEGIYNVTLTVWDDKGAKSSTTQQIVVNPKNNQLPVPRISGPTNIKVNQTVTFKDESYDTDGYIVSNSWGSKYLTVTYDKPGVYYINLSVTDNDNGTADTNIAIYVQDENYPIGK